MNNYQLFGLSALASLIASIAFEQLFVLPRLRNVGREQALISLVAPHMFLRFMGLSFLVRGVVSPSLPAALAVPAAYGDFVAGLMCGEPLIWSSR